MLCECQKIDTPLDSIKESKEVNIALGQENECVLLALLCK